MKQIADLRSMLDGIEAIHERESSSEQRLKAFEKTLLSIDAALAELVDMLESKPSDLTKVVDAIKSIKFPQQKEANVNVSPTPLTIVPSSVPVNVNPTPITVEAIMPAGLAPVVNIDSGQKIGSTWEARIPSSFGGPDRVMTIKRTG